MQELKSTDVVQLNAGGPKMSILRIIGADKTNFQLKTADELLKMQGFGEGDVICQWFEGNKLTSGTFKRDTLIIITPEK
ncbi:MAG: DUF2158 domain-containing protein [Bacteroidota bacterium]